MEHCTLAVGILEALVSALILYKIASARRGRSLFIRRIPGLAAIDEAVGRATEMGRPILFSPGMDPLSIVTLQALAVAGYVARTAARYNTRLIVPVRDPAIYPIAEEILREAYAAEGRPELFDPEDIRFLSDRQFAYASGCVGIMNRERVAANFFFGYFYAESLILGEAGTQVGALQVAGTPATTQLPFFIVSCDYTIMAEEFYAATAYLTREPVLLGSLVGQDWAKVGLVVLIGVGAALATVLGPASSVLRLMLTQFGGG